MRAATHATCDAYQRAIANGDTPATAVTHLCAIYNVKRPAIWRRLRAGGVLPPYKTATTPKGPVGRHAAGIMERRVVGPLPPVVHRDPCPRCGTRGDIDCGHSRNRLGMML